MTEKRKAHYDLQSIKAAFSRVDKLKISMIALKNAYALGLSDEDIVEVVQKTTRTMFYKSMTSHSDYRIWQDVYHVPWNDNVLYVKFTLDIKGYYLIQLKEK